MASQYPYHAGQEQKREKARVGNVTAGMMVGVSLLFDGTQSALLLMMPMKSIGFALIPFAWLIAGFAIITFGMWFALCGVNYFTGKQAARKIISAFSAVVVELVPLINGLPAITGGVVAIILASRVEDFAGKNNPLTNLSPVRKAALATSVLRGRNTADHRADPRASEKLSGGLKTLRSRTQGMRIDGGEQGYRGIGMRPRQARWEETVSGTKDAFTSSSLSTVPEKNTQDEIKEAA